MPTFSYIALKNNKDIVKGKVDALNVRAARDAVKKMGLLPTKITDDSISDKSTHNPAAQNISVHKIGSFSLKDKIEFTQTLQILTSTGIPIIETKPLSINKRTFMIDRTDEVDVNQIVKFYKA